jgi:outer membrane protein assembly factor BamD
MLRRILVFPLLLLLALGLAGCHNKKVQNPLADLGSKQPDKVLFDRAMDAMKHNKYDVARLTLQTLINTYPDSEYIARAKLAVGDSWYAEGSSTALAQAENEYKDFQTFFPNMTAEASEAQLKIANIHYRQMEKPDRDFTHAKRAEEEYRVLIMQYPDSPLVKEAKQRLLEVQEVLAEREFRIGRFYFMREAWAAAIARLRSVVDTYPLYSGADEALFLLGNAYEKQVEAVRASRLNEATKGRMIQHFTDEAAEAYSHLLTRYPVMARAGDAKQRLEALHRPVPTPTPEAVAQNKKEEESRSEVGMFGRLMLSMHRRPDVSMAAKVGEPTLVDPKQSSAPDVVREVTDALVKARGEAPASNRVTVETVGTGTPPPSQPVPRSEAPAAPPSGIPELKPLPSAQESPQAPLPPPQQINQAQEEAGQPSPTASQARQSKPGDKKEDDENVSSSRKKKKKGLRKLIPF